MDAALAVKITGIDEVHLEVKTLPSGLFAREEGIEPFAEMIPVHG